MILASTAQKSIYGSTNKKREKSKKLFFAHNFLKINEEQKVGEISDENN